MLRLLLPLSVLAACTPSPRKAAMPSPNPSSSPIAGSAAQAIETVADDRGSAMQAAQGPIPEPVSAAGIAAPPPPVDLPAAALGRRTLSTAFVRVGPDGHLTIDLWDGRVLVLRDVVMGPKDYCGVQVGKGGPVRYCGAYAEIAAARPGGAPAAGTSDAATGIRARPAS